jgi:hypothetical protein
MLRLLILLIFEGVFESLFHSSRKGILCQCNSRKFAWSKWSVFLTVCWNLG